MQLKPNLRYLRKLSLTSVLNTLGALLVSVILVGFISFSYARSELTQDLNATALIAGASVRGAVLASDADSANELLQNLRFSKNIVDAYIYVPGQTTVFASYQNSKNISRTLNSYTQFTLQSQTPIISNQYIVLSEPILLDNNIVASITMRSSLGILYQRYKLILYLCAIATILTLLLSLTLWQMTRSYWAKPFVRFARSLHMISLDNDYSRRLRIEDDDGFF